MTPRDRVLFVEPDGVEWSAAYEALEHTSSMLAGVYSSLRTTPFITFQV